MDGVRRLLTALPVLLATLLTLSAFDKKENNACLEYGVDVELTGSLKEEIFPGPPEWESVARGDEPYPYWILYLDKSICMNQFDDLIDVAEKDIDRIQIQPGSLDDMYKNYRRFLNTRVKVKGLLLHQRFGSDVTAVVMTTRKMDYAP